jgi:CheY-like chemotaxis protein
MNMQAVSEAHALKALEIYEKMQPDVILLDIGLPDMPGWKLLDAIKAKVQAAPEKTLPVIIVITAYGDPANRLMGKLQEVSRYLIKPFTPNEVEKVVQEALAQRHNKSAENPTEASEPTGNSPQDGTK